MIVFDLRCARDHTFEVWFRDSRTFERQRKKGEVACPVCGETEVEKALMAPNIATSRRKEAKQEQADAAQAMQMLAQMRDHIESHSDYVGPAFAEEARKIHHGETERRDIYGEATKEDADSLREDGIEFMQIPWLPRADN